MTTFELLAATAAAMLAVPPAIAQDGTSNPTAAGAVTEPRAGGEEDFQSANEIVVTATRRNETVQEVPIAITALAGDLIEDAGVRDIRGLEQLAPSLQTSTGQSSATGTTL